MLDMHFRNGRLKDVQAFQATAPIVMVVNEGAEVFVTVTVECSGTEVELFLDPAEFFKLVERVARADVRVAEVAPSMWLDGSPNSHEEKRPPEPAAQVLRAVVPDEGGA